MIDIKSQVPLINHDSRDSSRPSETAMSSRQLRDPSQPSAPHRHFAPSSTHSQGLASPNAPTMLHQPTLSAPTYTYPSSSQYVPGRGATQETPPSSYPIIIRNWRDFSLALSIQAARGDQRECPWYGVWSKVLQGYIFHEADGLQTACTCIPQYSLVASDDLGYVPRSGISDWSDIAMGSPSSDRCLITPGSLPGPPLVPHNHTPNFSPQSQALFEGPLPPLTPSPLPSAFPRNLSHPESPTIQHVTRLQARRAGGASNPPVTTRSLPRSSTPSYHNPSDGILPTTPSRPPTGTTNTSSRIPDFVQILEHAQLCFPATPAHVIRRVIMTVEIKPEPNGNEKVHWERIWTEQVMEQVLHAFEADCTLKYLGVIMAAGCRWVYSTVHRGPLIPRTMSERRDPTFPGIGQPLPQSTDSRADEWPQNQAFVPSLKRPDFVPPPGDKFLYEFNLLDAEGESLRVFQEIVKDLRHHNSDIWV